MHFHLRTSLFAAALAAFIAAAAAAQNLHLGRAIALEGDAATSAELEGTRPPVQLSDVDTLTASEADEGRRSAERVEAATDAVENRLLGQPQKLLTMRAAAADEGAEQLARGDRADGIFGGIRSDGLQVISALAVVLGLVFGVRTLLLRSAHRMSGGRPSGVLEILARYPVGRGQHLILLKLARRIVLVHQSGPTMSALSEINDPDEVAALLARIEAGSSSQREASRFRSLLSQFNREHEGTAVRAKQGEIKDVWSEGEIVDLTKRSRRGFGGLLSRKERRA